MDVAPEIVTTLEGWLRHFDAPAGAPACRTADIAAASAVPALAALAAEAMARRRTLWLATADDGLLPELSNALDLRLRPLCLVQPGADYAGRIALRATLSLLRSRLARAADDSTGPAWEALRHRLENDDALWRAAQAWNRRGLDAEAPPAGLAALFPVRIGPYTLAAQLAASADWVVLVEPERLPTALRGPWPGAQRTLLLAPSPAAAGRLVVSDAVARLRAEIEVLSQELAEMELELATAQAELAGFGERYRAMVAWRLAELDRIQAEWAVLRQRQAPADPALAEAARTASARAEQSQRESASHRSEPAPTDAPFRPAADLKKRFRQLAQKIHPDRASDEADRAWRTRLMSEANRAYRAGDAAALDEVLALWQAGAAAERPPAPAGTRPATTVSLMRQAADMRERISAIAAELDRLYGSKLYELSVAARTANRQGRDLLEEMAAQLDAQITEAQARCGMLAEPA